MAFIKLTLTGLVLHTYDEGNRPTRLYARDGLNRPLTLRQYSIYGDRPESGLTTQVARQNNLLGKLYRHYDEAGLVTVPTDDFKGNPLSQTRQVIGDNPLLSVFDNAVQRNWEISAFRVDWQPPTGTTLDAYAQTLLDATPYMTSMTYDALNRVKAMRYPQDVTGQRQELVPIYNRAGGLAQVKLNGQIYVEQIAYSAKGQRVLVTYGNGVMTRYAYDDRTFRLLRLRSEHYTKSGADSYQPVGAPLQDFAYEYDLIGNILNIQDRTPASGILNNPDAAQATDPQLAQLLASGNALIRRFDYDPIYRLLAATGRECDRPPDESPPWADEPRCVDLTRTRAYTERYQYDSMGNMLQLQHPMNGSARNRNFAMVTGNNRLDTVTIGQTVYRYVYDTNGNLIQENLSRQFEWDYGDRLKVFRTQTPGAEPSVHAQYLYDASGMRVKKFVRKQGGQIAVTVYVGGIFEYQRLVQGTTTLENNTLHVMDDKSRIALVRVGNPFPDDTTPAVKYHLGDHLGSSNVVVGGDGEWVNREEYTPYGETSFGSFAKKRYRFTGKERDEESGLNYHGARYYACWLGKWLSFDQSISHQTSQAFPNTFVYGKSNPLGFTDPDGKDDVSINPKSEISAEQWADKIKQSNSTDQHEKVPDDIKKNVKVSKDHKSITGLAKTKKPSKTISDWPTDFGKAFSSNLWEITTGELNIDVKKNNTGLTITTLIVPHLQKGEKLGTPQKAYEGGTWWAAAYLGESFGDINKVRITYGRTFSSDEVEKRRLSKEKGTTDLSSLNSKRALIVIITKINLTKDGGPTETFIVPDDMLLEVFLHELSLHAGRMVQGKPSAHREPLAVDNEVFGDASDDQNLIRGRFPKNSTTQDIFDVIKK